MKLKTPLLFLIWLLIALFFPLHSAFAGCNSSNPAAVVVTASFTGTDIQTCWDAMSSGGTMSIGAGSATISSTITFGGKAGTVLGATTCTGAGSTLACSDNTTLNCSGSIQCISLNGGTGAFVSVGGLTVNASACLANNGAVGLSGDLNVSSFRFHTIHIAFSGSCSDPGWIIAEGAYGLMDHLLITNSANQHTFAIYGQFSSSGLNNWNTTQAWGDANAIFLEDSKVTATNGTDGIMDGYAGGRVVVRDNYFLWSSGSGDTIAFHGFDSGSFRSFMTAEIYDNTYVNNSGNTLQAGRFRGGTALVHDNDFAGANSWNGVSLQTFRTGMGCTATSYPDCNGTQYRYTANGNQTIIGTGETSKFCAANRDTLCTADSTCNALSGGDTCTAWVDGNGTGGYLCRDQPGTTHNQTSSPIYVWNNTGGVAAGAGCDTSYVQSGRDFVNGSGPGGYAPYTYPHPLQGAAASGTDFGSTSRGRFHR